MKPLKPKESLNKAFLKIKPNRSDIEVFKANLIQLIDTSTENPEQHEEFHKNLVSSFLNKTYYDGKHYINIHNRQDLVIHNDKAAKSSVGVIIEAKRLDNKTERMS
jgi:adenine-specific DNA-methyltransferase